MPLVDSTSQRRLAALLSLLAGLFAMASPYVSLADDVDQATARALSASGQILPLEKIYAAAKASKPGKILETELESKQGIYVYEVELLDSEGTVWEIKLNAKTGAIIELEED